MNLFTMWKKTHRFQKQTYDYQRGTTWGKDKIGAWG